MNKRRKDAEGVEHEYYNSLFTDLQKILKRLKSWDFSITKEGIKTEANELEKMNFLLMYHQIEQQKRYTSWFICLTIINIVVLILTAYITLCK